MSSDTGSSHKTAREQLVEFKSSIRDGLLRHLEFERALDAAKTAETGLNVFANMTANLDELIAIQDRLGVNIMPFLTALKIDHRKIGPRSEAVKFLLALL